MEPNDNTQKDPWGIFSNIDGREIFELLDTQQMRALSAASNSAPRVGGLAQTDAVFRDTTNAQTPVDQNYEVPNSGGNASYPSYTSQPNPYVSAERDIHAGEIARARSPMPPPPPLADNGMYQAQMQMRASLTESPQNDGLPHIQSFSPTPRFDLETLVIESGVPAMTVRAWERKYGIPSPWRGGNSYTVYSSRDVAVVRWLRKRIASGISVRQAMTEFARYEPEYAFSKGVNPLTSSSTLPLKRNLSDMREPLMRALTLMDEVGAERILSDAFATYPIGFVCQHLLQPVLVQIVEQRKLNNLPLACEIFAAKITRSQVVHLIEAGISPKESLQRLSALALQAPNAYDMMQKEKQQRGARATDLVSLEDPLLECFRRLDEAGVQRLFDEAFFYHSVEDVCMNLIQAVLYRVGMLWAEQKLSVTVEHFASNLIRTRLSHLFQSTPNLRQGASILTGCAPKETHEIGVLMLALFWRRAGLNVYYLGQMLELQSLMQEIRSMRPGIVCLSATTRPRVKDLAEVGREITKMSSPKPIFCFGGGAFGRDEALIKSVKGVFLGPNGTIATQRIKELARLQASFSQTEIDNILSQ